MADFYDRDQSGTISFVEALEAFTCPHGCCVEDIERADRLKSLKPNMVEQKFDEQNFLIFTQCLQNHLNHHGIQEIRSKSTTFLIFLANMF